MIAERDERPPVVDQHRQEGLSMNTAPRTPLGWRTDLDVRRLGGSEIEDRGDHLVVRTPTNPTYHWGNFVFARERVHDAEHWLAVFEAAFPEARHRAIGLAALPTDDAPWTAQGLVVEHDEVLAAAQLPGAHPLPEGYDVRQLLSDADWEASTALRLPEGQEFAMGTTRTRSAMTADGATAWFGAFAADGSLASELGIVDCGGGLARYQSVLTHEDHRRRGLTSHLLGVAAAWAAKRDVTRWVIVAEAASNAARLYRRAGFAPVETNAQAYRKS
jgi:GNAT superfamily N-acetyltransferase